MNLTFISSSIQNEDVDEHELQRRVLQQLNLLLDDCNHEHANNMRSLSMDKHVVEDMQFYAYTLHLWNRFSGPFPISRGSAFQSIMQARCPVVYEQEAGT